MDDFRKNSLFSERGIAIITSLIIAIATIALIGGVFYMLQSGIKINTINKQFSTAQEAALGGIEHGTAIIKNVLSYKGELPEELREGLGIPMGTDYDSGIYNGIYKCDSSKVVELKLQTAKRISTSQGQLQGQFDIHLTVQCLNRLPIPGFESLVFPPPPTGTGGNKPYYFFYRIRSIAKDSLTNRIADVEAVYRIAI